MFYCIGDSHASVFSGHKDIIPCYPEKHQPLVDCFRAFRIGAPTAYNMYDNKMKEIKKVISEVNVTKDDYVMIVAGEIDCRCHLVKQYKLQNKPSDVIIKECVDRYGKVLTEVKNMGINTCAWNVVVPSTYSYPDQPVDQWSHVGTFEERNNAAIMFNKCLESFCGDNDIYFISIYDSLLSSFGESNGVCRASPYYRDETHLCANVIPIIKEAIGLTIGKKI